MGVMFITHDLGVIAQTADTVAVMYLGAIVEKGPVREIIKNPKHPYTRGLLNALPDINNLGCPSSDQFRGVFQVLLKDRAVVFFEHVAPTLLMNVKRGI